MDNLVKEFTSNCIVDDLNNYYSSIRKLCKTIHVDRQRLSSALNKKGYFCHNGRTYRLYRPVYEEIPIQVVDKPKNEVPQNDAPYDNTQMNIEAVNFDPDFQEFKKSKEISTLPFTKYDFKLTRRESGTRYCVALFSDVHIGQTIESESVMGMNEYTTDIAEKRVMNYFNNLVSCLNTDHVDNLVFGCLGDIIDGYLRDSALANNELSPLESVMKGQSLIYEGLKFICNNTNIKNILFVGIVGNHGRMTPKTWSVGAYKVNLEWLMYKNVERMCEIAKLPIEFSIPCSDMTVVAIGNENKFAFFHGEQVKGGNGITGPINTLYRHYLKLKTSLGINKFFCGHFHQYISLNPFTANGCICGSNNFSVSMGFPPERPSQSYELYDNNIGWLLSRQIYCD